METFFTIGLIALTVYAVLCAVSIIKEKKKALARKEAKARKDKENA